MEALLVYLICSAADPTVCEEHRIAAPGMETCVYGAQMEMARAITPGWRVQRWRCQPGGPPDTEVARARDEPVPIGEPVPGQETK